MPSRAPFTAAILAFVLAGCIAETPPADSGGQKVMGSNFVVPETLTFDDGREVLHTPNGAEPGAEVGPDGTLYVVAWTNLHRSDDGGVTWTGLPTPFSHNGDSDLAVTPDGVLHFVGMPLADQEGPRLPYYRSTDKGQTWSEPRDLGAGQNIDRPWIVEDSRGFLVLTWNHFETDENLVRVSKDAGVTWSEPIVVASPRYKVPGPAVVRWDWIIQPLNGFNRIDFAVSKDLGASWRIVKGLEGSFVGFPTLALTQSGAVFLAATRLQGETRTVVVYQAQDLPGAWSGPIVASGEQDAVMPWIVGGQQDDWAVAFYASEPLPDDRNQVEQLVQPAPTGRRWHVDVAMDDAYEQGTIRRVRAASDVRFGEICSDGAGCAADSWQFKDYFEMEVTPFGNLFVVHMTGPSPAGDFPVRATISKYG